MDKKFLENKFICLDLKWTPSDMIRKRSYKAQDINLLYGKIKNISKNKQG